MRLLRSSTPRPVTLIVRHLEISATGDRHHEGHEEHEDGIRRSL